jgi:hypothetical protein
VSPKKQDDDEDAGEEEEPEKEEPTPEVQAADEGEEILWKAEVQKLSKMVPIAASGDGEKKEEPKDDAAKPAGDDKQAKAEAPTHRWTERGAGPLTLLRNVETDARRITLRQKGVGKILLNTPVIGKHFTSEGNQTVRLLAVDGDLDDPTKLCSYRLKFRAKQERDDFIQLVAH